MVRTRNMITLGEGELKLGLKPKRKCTNRGKDWEAILRCNREAEEAQELEIEVIKIVEAPKVPPEPPVMMTPRRGRGRPSKKHNTTVQARNDSSELEPHPWSSSPKSKPAETGVKSYLELPDPPAPPNSPRSWAIKFSALDSAELRTRLLEYLSSQSLDRFPGDASISLRISDRTESKQTFGTDGHTRNL